MATTAQWVFEKAMHLMDEVNESTGAADTNDTKEYKNRTLPILNILRIECFPASDNYTVTTPGKRPVCPEIKDFYSEIGMDDGICQGVLPYGLAAHLLLDENPAVASYFQQRYEEALSAAGRGIPAGSEEIIDLYGGIGFGQFARWSSDTGVYEDTGVYSGGEAPTIGANGNWVIGGKDTGVSATGPAGATPHIGENGNWYIGDVDIGVKASGANGKDGTSVTVQTVTESAEDGGSNVVTFSDGKSVTIKNGKTGAKGDTGAAGATPKKGIDYWTAEDEQTIVADVLAHFTDVSEVGM